MALTETEELEMLRLRKQRAMSQTAPVEAPASAGPPQIPTGVPSEDARLSAEAAAPRPAPPGPMDKVRGAVEAALQIGSQVEQGLGGMLGTAVGATGGVVAAMGRALLGRPQPSGNSIDAAATRGGEIGRGLVSSSQPKFPISETGQDYTSAVSDEMRHVDPQIAMTMTPAGGSGVAAAAPRAAQVARTVAAPVARGAVKVAEGAGAVAEGTARAAIGVDPELAKVAAIATEKFPDIQVSPDRLALSGTRKDVGSALATAPGGGGASVAAANTKAFTNYLVKMINPEETSGRLTPQTLSTALDRSGGTIGEIAGKTKLPLQSVDEALAPHVDDAVRLGAGDSPRIIANYANDLMAKADESGIVPGAAFREWDSKVGRQIRSTTDSDLAGRLSDLQDAGRDVLQANITDPAEVGALKTARREYAYGMVMMPEAAKSINGVVEPGSLMARVTSNRIGKRFMGTDNGGELGDLAKVGKLIEQPAVGGIGGKTAKALLAPVAQVHNRLGPKITKMLTKREPTPEAPPPVASELEPVKTEAPAQYADVPEWRKAHGLGAEDAQRALLTRQAHDLDADAVEAAAVQFNHSPRAFDRAIDKILEKHRANELKQTPGSSESPATETVKPAGSVGGTSQRDGADSVPATGANSAKDQSSGSAVEDPVAEAARLAKFHLDHPRAADGTFTDKES